MWPTSRNSLTSCFDTIEIISRSVKTLITPGLLYIYVIANEQALGDELDEVMVRVARNNDSEYTASVWDCAYEALTNAANQLRDDQPLTAVYNDAAELALERVDNDDARQLIQLLIDAELDSGSTYNAFHELSDCYQIPRHTTDREFNDIVLDVSK